MKPSAHNASLDIIRVRFTPATGEVYGPPFAKESRTIYSDPLHVIVKKRNRILNPAASWTSFNHIKSPQLSPQPNDTYDGCDDLNRDSTSWGVVDDTCDAVITATIGELSASARVLAGPPDFAPDRRPFFSLADDLADRDPGSWKRRLKKATREDREEAIVDLFRRVSEVASLTNVDRGRIAAINENHRKEQIANFPAIQADMMTPKDFIKQKKHMLSMRAAQETKQPVGEGANNAPLLPRAEYANLRHAELAQPAVLLPFLKANRQRVLDLLRPPFAYASELTQRIKKRDPYALRDPRFPRSYAFDMRMPPFMRDCDFAPLSLTRLQWDLLLSFLDEKSTTK